MDYEKKYNEALERAKRLRDSFYQTMNAKRVVEEIFPELAESEDERNERIRKAIVHLLEVASEAYLIDATGFKKEQFLSWLEKQKESLHISEMCKENADSFTDGIIEVRSFQRGMEEGRRLEKQKEQKPVEWSDNFEDNIRTLLHDKLTWHSEDGNMSSTVFIDDKTLKDIISGIWFYVGKEALKYPNKELNVPEWSEEDEKMLNEVLDRVIYAFYDQGKEGEIEDDPAFLWLHRLRPSWKPSEEQMRVLKQVEDRVAMKDGYWEQVLDSLYLDLQKL